MSTKNLYEPSHAVKALGWPCGWEYKIDTPLARKIREQKEQKAAQRLPGGVDEVAGVDPVWKGLTHEQKKRLAPLFIRAFLDDGTDEDAAVNTLIVELRMLGHEILLERSEKAAKKRRRVEEDADWLEWFDERERLKEHQTMRRYFGR